MQEYKIIFIAGNDIVECFNKHNTDENIIINSVFNGASPNHAEMAEAVKDGIIIVDTVTVNPDTVQNLISLLQSKRGYIAIVSDIKTGFVYLNQGAVDIIVKPPVLNLGTADAFIFSLCTKIRTSGKKGQELNQRDLKYSGPGISDKIIAIGSSTGGTEIVLSILKEFPINFPPVLITQHMPPVFTKLFADRLNGICKMSVWEAKNGDLLRPGLAFIAPGDQQMRIKSKNNSLIIETTPGEKVSGLCPSVDALFLSVAEAVGNKAIGVILTGMGSDGAKGLLEMRKKGALTIGQNEKSSIVYGMPKAAFDAGAVMRQLDTEDIAPLILKSL